MEVEIDILKNRVRTLELVIKLLVSGKPLSDAEILWMKEMTKNL